MAYSLRLYYGAAIATLLLAVSQTAMSFSAIPSMERTYRLNKAFQLQMTSANDLSNESRRSFMKNLALLSSTIATTSSVPLISNAEEEEPKKFKGKPLESCIYTILRVREATEQETRLIKSGKFKDVQRANIKLAVRFMVNNYRLADNFVAASAYLEGSKRIEAGNVGQNAVQSLYTILEYFDSADVQNLKVGSASLAGKDTIVINGLDSVRKDIDSFLSYFPSDVIDSQSAKIKEENDLNEAEFDTSLGAIINLKPVKN
uniref:Uncharacterized protein n=1 Tax=Ditylum brightwellii TaxID=49249 RepID=A0A6U3UKQ2_9STRA|mmetsp:Transcript_25138/g.37496  ORF Transcript_25138/g.37496 Transcript_25138/m.37496 type:complete len:260 (+) Transcript_25138:58-837(+)